MEYIINKKIESGRRIEYEKRALDICDKFIGERLSGFVRDTECSEES